jgi:hypothetical protein
MQTLFMTLNENTDSEAPDDRLIVVPANAEGGDVSYFQRSSLIGLETIPV